MSGEGQTKGSNALRRQQEALIKMGFNVGEDGATGVMNKETRTAIEEFKLMVPEVPGRSTQQSILLWAQVAEENAKSYTETWKKRASYTETITPAQAFAALVQEQQKLGKLESHLTAEALSVLHRGNPRFADMQYGTEFALTSEERIRKDQQNLIALGFLPKGSDDGILGPQTRAALQDFVMSHDNASLDTIRKSLREEGEKFKDNPKPYITPAQRIANIKAEQNALIEMGYNLGPDGADGVRGHLTQKAIEQYRGSKQFTDVSTKSKVGTSLHDVMIKSGNIARVEREKKEELAQKEERSQFLKTTKIEPVKIERPEIKIDPVLVSKHIKPLDIDKLVAKTPETKPEEEQTKKSKKGLGKFLEKVGDKVEDQVDKVGDKVKKGKFKIPTIPKIPGR